MTQVTVAALIVPFAWAGACHLAMWAAGSWLRPLLERGADRPEEPAAERAFLSAMLGFSALGAITLLLGFLRLLYAPLLGGIIAVAAGAGAVRLCRHRPSGIPRFSLPGGAWLAAALGVLAYVPGTLHPVLEWDENTYHLALPRLYLAKHALVGLPWNLFANMPHEIDLTYAGPFALGGVAAARLFVLGFVLWTLVGMGPAARRIAGPWGPAIAALLFLSGANVRWHLGVTYVEPVLGALLLGAMLCVGTTSLRTFAILAGTACASKYTAWPFVAVLFAAAWVSLPRRRVAKIAGTAAIAALPVAPWLLKNAIVTGNPIYPNLFSLLGGVHWSGIQAMHLARSVALAGGPAKTIGTYLAIPWNLVTADPSVFYCASFSGGLMISFLAALCLPWRRGDRSVNERLVAAAGLAAWAAGDQQGRFLVAWIPVMILAACHALAPLRRFSAAPAFVIVAIAGLAAAQSQRWPDTPRLRFGVFTHSREEMLAEDPTSDLATLLNRVVPPGKTVLALWENRFYYLDRPSIADSAWEAPSILAALRESGDAGAFAQAMAASGVTHVVLNYGACERFVSNGLGFDLLDDRVYPAARLHDDVELLHRFVREHLEPVPWDGAWPVFRLKEAAEPVR